MKEKIIRKKTPKIHPFYTWRRGGGPRGMDDGFPKKYTNKLLV